VFMARAAAPTFSGTAGSTRTNEIFMFAVFIKKNSELKNKFSSL